MISLRFIGARAICAAVLISGIVGAAGCEREKSVPPVDSPAAGPAQSPRFPASPPGTPEASPEDMRAFAAAHLPPGWKPGDFLTKKSDYPTGDTADVIRAVLDTLYAPRDGKSPGEVIINDFATTGFVTCVHMPCPIKPLGMGREAKMETLDAYRIARLTRRHITPKLKYRLPVRLIGEEEQRELEIEGRTILSRDSAAGRSNQEHPFWIGFAAKHPKAWGFVVFSTVGMNPQKNEAILQVSHRCGSTCHSIETMFLWKVRGRWHVIERVPEEGEQDYRGLTTLRYAGLDYKKPESEVQAEARAKQVADSLKADSLPRDIHGRLTSTNGEPIADATITLHDGDNPNRPDVFANTDADGNYRFVKPAIGQPGVMVRCSHASKRPDSLMLVTGTTVTAGTLRELNMTADRRVCDDAENAGEVTIIQPAFDAPPIRNNADIERAMKSSFPSADETAVYRTLLDNMFSIEPGEERLLYMTTRTACTIGHCDDQWLDRIRYEPIIIMSAMQNFLARRQQKFDFNASFAPGPNVTMIGDSAIAQLQRASGYGDAFDNPGVLQRAWPNVKKVYSFSPIGFSPNHKQAIVEVIRAGMGSQNSELWILNRTATGWNIVRWFSSSTRR